MGVQPPKRSPDAGVGLFERAIGQVYVQTAHQAVAWDAVSRLAGPQAALWRRVLHGQARLLTLGAKVPDTEFRDFKNHIVFPREAYWGGAIGRAQSWYQNLTVALSRSEWANAAYCAGVMAHYVADALHPLHTAQSAAENDIHFACDLTTEVTLTSLRRMAAALEPSARHKLADGTGFLAPAIAAGADAAHLRYESLLAHFDLRRAVADPAAGLDQIGQRLMAAILDDQTRLIAAILDRAIADAGVAAPTVVPDSAGWSAALAWPVAHWQGRRRVAEARRHVAVMYDEISASGRATTTLPDEERIKRDLYAKEIVARRAEVVIDNVFPFAPRRPMARPADPARPAMLDDEDSGEIIVLDRRRAVIEQPRPAPRWVEAEVVRRRAETARAGVADATAAQPQPAILPERTTPPPAPVGVGHAAAAMLLPASVEGLSNFRDRRRGALGEREAAIPAVVGARVERQSITVAAPRAGEARTQLLASVPELTTAEADLLVGSGYGTASAIADADAEKLCADILAYVATPAGNLALVAGPPPDIAQVRAVIEKARAVRAA